MVGFGHYSLNTFETQSGCARHGSPTCGFARRKGAAWVHVGQSRGPGLDQGSETRSKPQLP